MDKNFRELLENIVLNEETKNAISEAWEAKLNDVRKSVKEEVETEIRNDFASRYETDKSDIVEAMNSMISEAVEHNSRETFDAVKALKEQREELAKTIKESRKEYKAKLDSNLNTIESFVVSQLKESVTTLNDDLKSLREYRNKMAVRESELKDEFDRKLLEHKEALDTEYAGRINKLEKFVTEKLKTEIAEFETDKQNLANAKVKIMTEARKKMFEAKQSIIKRTAKLVEEQIETRVTTEIQQLKEDIQAAKENVFGRRLFEAFKSEFNISYFSESEIAKNLNNKIVEVSTRLEEAESKLSQKESLVEHLSRKVKISEESNLREKTLSSLLSPLSNEKREVMRELLESVKTTGLKDSFDKYLPAVLNESAKGKPSRRLISESTTNRTVEITGNRNNRLTESAQADSIHNDQSEIINLRRLAGIIDKK